MASKRPHANNSTASSSKCMFGLKCYRRNPNHFESFSHPHINAIIECEGSEARVRECLANLVQSGADEATLKDQIEIVRNLSRSSQQGSPRKKQNKEQSNGEQKGQSTPTEASQSNLNGKNESSNKGVLYYLTRIKDVPSTHKGDGKSIYLTNFLRPSGGVKLKETLQINFMVEFEWLWMNYEVVKIQDIPLTILYGEDNEDLKEKARLPNKVTAAKVRLPNPFGTHHTKMMVLVYEDDSVRVIVSTANLVPSDWENRTQGVWVGPRCPKRPDVTRTNGDSETGFKASVLRYLNFYQMGQLRQFISAIESCDFKEVNAFFVASVPGSHQTDLWGHRAVNAILRRHLDQKQVTANWPLIIQCSSIGSLGPTPESWVETELASNLGRGSRSVHLVYPSKSNVLNSLDGILGGGCLPYSRSTHEKQPWLCELMHEWKSDDHERTRAMPHIKTYTKVSPDGESLAFVLLTSANLSKAAWGSLNKDGDKLHIKSYEAGVLFLPKFVTGKDVFDFKNGEHKFYLPYDLPLKKFGPKDVPWLYDYLRI